MERKIWTIQRWRLRRLNLYFSLLESNVIIRDFKDFFEFGKLIEPEQIETRNKDIITSILVSLLISKKYSLTNSVISKNIINKSINKGNLILNFLNK